MRYKRGDKKEVLQELLFDTYNRIAKYDTPSNVDKINLLKRITKYIKEKRERIWTGFAHKSKCKNSEDCFTMESIHDLPDMIYFFSIKDSYYGSILFSIRTFKLVDKDSTNPREPFLQESLDLFRDRLEHMEKHDISDAIFQKKKNSRKNLTPEEKVNNKLMDIFR